MITIRRLRCAAAAMGLLVGVSVLLTLPQHLLAQAGVGDDAAGVVGSSATAPLTGSRLHVEPGGEAAEGTASAPEPATHADMAQTARNGRKPVVLIPTATTAFKPATVKPPPIAAGEDAAEQEPAAEQATETDQPSGTKSAPAVAEPAPSREGAVVARLPDRTPGDMAAGDAAPGDGTATEAEAGDAQAALPPASDPAQSSAVARLAFARESATLSAEAKGVLKNLALSFPAHDEGARLQLMAYASGKGMSASKARRLSLARALSVREYLIANGIDGARMDVRALGDEAAKSPSGSPAGSPADLPSNRVDIAMIRR